jgi:transposase
MSAAARSESSPAPPEPPKPPPWTPEQLRQISGYVTAGLSIPVACEAAGVKWSTAKWWLAQGKKGIAPYEPFADAMRQSKAMHEAACRVAVSKHMGSDWRAAAWSWEKLESQRQLERKLGRDASADPTLGAPVVIRYPVPMPVGAEPDQTLVPRLPSEHAIDRAAASSANEESDDDASDDDDDW